MPDKDRRAKHKIEPIGKRIARLRTARGWTQQYLAERLAMSRVAISHIELALSTPSERTITLLAGLFKTDPHELIAGTTYPEAKGERLPQSVCFYTPLELQLALLENDLAWLDRLAHLDECNKLAEQVRQDWSLRLGNLARVSIDSHDRDAIASAHEKLRNLQNDSYINQF